MLLPFKAFFTFQIFMLVSWLVNDTVNYRGSVKFNKMQQNLVNSKFKRPNYISFGLSRFEISKLLPPPPTHSIKITEQTAFSLTWKTNI